MKSVTFLLPEMWQCGLEMPKCSSGAIDGNGHDRYLEVMKVLFSPAEANVSSEMHLGLAIGWWFLPWIFGKVSHFGFRLEAHNLVSWCRICLKTMVILVGKFQGIYTALRYRHFCIWAKWVFTHGGGTGLLRDGFIGQVDCL